MFRTRFLVYGALAFLVAMPVAQAGLVWRAGEGWSDESGGDVSASSSRDQLELAHKLEAQGQRDDALKAYRNLLRRWPLSFFAPEAQFRMGKILEDQGDFASAFQAFQKMVQKYPSSDYFEQAMGEQYRIANLYLAGEPQRIWKIPLGPSMDKTVEMYERIIKNAPYGAHAAECEFKIGLAREKQRKYTDAIDAYQRVLDSYPGSPVASNAQYQIGYAWMHASNNGDYDQGAAKKATEAFQDYLVRYPNSDKAAQAQENIQHLGQKQTQGAYNIAKFYETQHDTRAAFIYYNEVVREDPNSPQAQQAKKRIQELRPIVEAMPGGAGPDGTPAPQTLASGPQAPGIALFERSFGDLAYTFPRLLLHQFLPSPNLSRCACARQRAAGYHTAATMSRKAVLSRVGCTLLLLLAVTGCAGYRVGNISGRDLQGVRSVYVPVARNSSLEPDVQVTVTNAIIRRFNNDGSLEVNQNAKADSELDVTIVSVHRTAVRSSTSDILVTAQYQLTIEATVTFTNRRLGRKIFENAHVMGSTTFFTQANIQEGERQALPLAAEDLATNVVKLVTEGW